MYCLVFNRQVNVRAFHTFTCKCKRAGRFDAVCNRGVEHKVVVEQLVEVC